MSLLPQIVYEVPEETARIAHAAFPKSNPYLRLADTLGVIYQDGDFAQLFPFTGQPALAPIRLALTTILQFTEGLSDRQAADAVRGRLDWKYLLCLELTDPGFEASVLCEFRARLIAGEAEELLRTKLLALCQERGWLKARGRQRTDSTHILAAVRMLNRLARVSETLRATLNEGAAVAPDWLRARAPVAWYERYARRIENYQLPKSDAAREDYAAQVARDGAALLGWLDEPDTDPKLPPLICVQPLRQIWAEQFTTTTQGLRLRPVKEMPAVAALLASPYEVDARWSTKRGMDWVGYKVHWTETCEPEQAHLITEVTTTPATTPADNMLAPIHAKLAARELLPAEHLVDKGYTSAAVLVAAQQDYDVQLVGPVAADPSWQARLSPAFAKAHFQVDWERRVNSRILFDQMMGRATRLCSEVGKETFRIFDAVRIYEALQLLTKMQPVVVNPNITFTQLAGELATVTDNEARTLVRDQFIAKLQRKKRTMTEKSAQDFQTVTGMTPDVFISQVKAMPLDELAAWFSAANAQGTFLSEILDRKGEGTAPRILISEHEDELHSIERGYGNAMRPEDYLHEFAEFIRSNRNSIPALMTVLTRPRELTRKQLRELLMALDSAGYTEANLATAWREMTNQEIAARIVGYIRQAAIGDALTPFDQRVDRALQKLLAAQSWTTPQRQWLQKIAAQTKANLIVDRDALDDPNQLFKREGGGFQRLDKIFDGHLQQVLESFNDSLWQTAA